MRNSGALALQLGAKRRRVVICISQILQARPVSHVACVRCWQVEYREWREREAGAETGGKEAAQRVRGGAGGGELRSDKEDCTTHQNTHIENVCV
jgi:hypothetical protein